MRKWTHRFICHVRYISIITRLGFVHAYNSILYYSSIKGWGKGDLELMGVLSVADYRYIMYQHTLLLLDDLTRSAVRMF
jgi:hypothetical protein